MERLREERDDARLLPAVAGAPCVVERELECRPAVLPARRDRVCLADQPPRAREAGVVAELLEHGQRLLRDRHDLRRRRGRSRQRRVELELDCGADLQPAVARRRALRLEERGAPLREVA